MRIEELHLKNFRCFKELDIQFPKSNLAVFIGLNGAGKSAILDAILLALNNFQRHEWSGIENYDAQYNSGDIYYHQSVIETELVFNLRKSFSWKVTFDKDNISGKITPPPRSKNIPLTKQEEINELLKAMNDEDNRRHKHMTIMGFPLPVFLFVYYKADKKENYVLGNESRKTDLDKFKDWFKEELDLEREVRLEDDNNYSNPRLNVVRKAMDRFLPCMNDMKFSNLKIKRDTKNRKVIGSYEEEIDKIIPDLAITDKEGKELKFSQLSDGQRILLYRVCDIAYQLVKVMEVSCGEYKVADDDGEFLEYKYSNDLTEDDIEDILKTSGVVLIDEIELHLHPQWQREVLPALQKTFPNIQFIVTTHSPQVLSRVHKDDIFILKDNKLYQPSSNPIGRDSSDILNQIMDITNRPEDIQKLADNYFLLINKNQFTEAQEIRNQLLELVKNKKLDKDDPIFIRADAILTRKRLLGK